MVKIPTPASWKPTCPICQGSFDRDNLAKHIKESHTKVPLASLARALYEASGKNVPENLDSLKFDELTEALAIFCIDAKTKSEMAKLRKRVVKRSKS